MSQGYTYQWQVTGGNIAAGQGTPVIKVNWGPANAQAGVSVKPVNQYGCEGDISRLPVRINVVLETEAPRDWIQFAQILQIIIFTR